MPEGHTFAEFLLIMRTGIDLDQAHPQYGPLLQVMPWPALRNLTDEDIRAIYEYLSALPPEPESLVQGYSPTAVSPGSPPFSRSGKVRIPESASCLISGFLPK